MAKILAEKQAETLEAELALEHLMGKQAERNAERLNFSREIEERDGQVKNLEDQKITIDERLATLENNNLFTQALTSSEKKLASAELDITRLRLAFNEAEDHRQSLQQQEQDARNSLQAVQSKFARIKAEKEALEELLSSSQNENGRPILEVLSVTKGYETALGAALDADLEVTDDLNTPVHWRDLPPLKVINKMPREIKTLDHFVSGPSLLTRRLSQIGIVENEKIAVELMEQLLPGQRLVTLNGGVWRWDGLCVSPDAPSGAAIRLAQKNRLLGVF